MPGVLVAARKAAGAFARLREEPGPKAVAGPRIDLDEPLAGSTFKEPTRRKRSRTTNAIERHLGEAGRGPPRRLRRSLQHRKDPFRRLQLRNPRTWESVPLSRWHGTHGITERRRAPANRNGGRRIWTSLLVRCDCVPDTTLLALTQNGEILKILPGFGSADRRATCAE